jgi:hypothetical protein
MSLSAEGTACSTSRSRRHAGQGRGGGGGRPAARARRAPRRACAMAVPADVREPSGIWCALSERQTPSGWKKSTVSWSITGATSSTPSPSRSRAPATPRPPRCCARPRAAH